MKKVSSIFWVSEDYVVDNFRNEATVVLEIDYHTNKYKITPYCGGKDGLFNFYYASNKPELSKAVAIAIIKAIEFAQEELRK
jgi:hypothetical protein